jgi:hypothetical protein
LNVIGIAFSPHLLASYYWHGFSCHTARRKIKIEGKEYTIVNVIVEGWGRAGEGIQAISMTAKRVGGGGLRQFQ